MINRELNKLSITDFANMLSVKPTDEIKKELLKLCGELQVDSDFFENEINLKAISAYLSYITTTSEEERKLLLMAYGVGDFDSLLREAIKHDKIIFGNISSHLLRNKLVVTFEFNGLKIETRMDINNDTGKSDVEFLRQKMKEWLPDGCTV